MPVSRSSVRPSVQRMVTLSYGNCLKWFLSITAPAQPHYSPRPSTYCPCPLALLPLPTSSDYWLAVYPALFSKNLEIFLSRIRDLRKKDKIFFWKMFFKSGVQSIGNFLICLDPKSCIFTFFQKLWNFFVARQGLRKKSHKIFYYRHTGLIGTAGANRDSNLKNGSQCDISNPVNFFLFLSSFLQYLVNLGWHTAVYVVL